MPITQTDIHSLTGETRVWTHPAGREDIYQTMIHTHLNQSAGFSHSLSSLNMMGVGCNLSIPITFVLPEFATGSGSHHISNNSSKRIPPSCESGSLYLDPWGRSYKQPLIEYYLQATLQYHPVNETAVRTISAKHKIRITTALHSDPPTYSEKASGLEPVTASTAVSRSRFSKSFAKLTLAMAEPSPVVAHGASGCCQTTGLLLMTWETSSGAYDEFESGERRVEVEYRLQARTRYSTRVVHSDEKNSGDGASTQERLEITPLGTFEVCATDRNDVRIIACEKRWRGHTGTIPIPVQVAEGTVPTFSHVLASRDYTLLVKVRVQGLQHKALSVKVPLQICESSAVNDDNRLGARSEVYAKMALSEVSSLLFANGSRQSIIMADNIQVLPRYEDHQYSLSP
jgi:hypothetical protein